MAQVKLGGPTAKGARLQRIKFAMGLLMQMLPPNVVIDKVADKFGIKPATAKRDYLDARSELAQQPVMDTDERRNQVRAALGVAYVECMSKGSHGPAVRALRELALLDGLYPDAYMAARSTGAHSSGEESDVGATESPRIRERMAGLLVKHAATIEAIKSGAAVPKAVDGIGISCENSSVKTGGSNGQS